MGICAHIAVGYITGQNIPKTLAVTTAKITVADTAHAGDKVIAPW